MHDLAYARLPGGVGQPHSTDDIDGGVELRIGNRVAHIDLRGQVEYHLGREFGHDGVQICLDDVVLDEGEGGMRLGGLQIRHLAGGEVIQARYLVPVRQQPVDQRRSDKSCGSGNHCPHVATPSLFT